MSTQTYFKVGKNKISWVVSNFREWFSDMEIDIPKEAKLESKKLPRYMNDKEIFSELRPEEVRLGDVIYAMENILTKKDWAIFYVKDRNEVLRAVIVGWNVVGWSVGAFSVEDTNEWNDGSQVFSRNFLETKDTPHPISSSDTLSLESLDARVQKVEEILSKLAEIFK